jgi:hypothetical protein
MHTVCELKSFEHAAYQAGMTAEEIDELIDFLSLHPSAGEAMEGTGGCRKLRFPGRGKGKSGGYRTVTFYSGDEVPVFLLTVFSKGERANLTKRECNELAALARRLNGEYRGRVVNAKTVVKIKRR